MKNLYLYSPNWKRVRRQPDFFAKNQIEVGFEVTPIVETWENTGKKIRIVWIMSVRKKFWNEWDKFRRDADQGENNELLKQIDTWCFES